MHKLLILMVLIISLGNVYGMSRAQLKKTLSIMKNQCMTKIGVTEDKVGKIEQGVFLEEQDVMCYIACIYKSIQVIKKDKLDKELVLKQVDILYPPEMKDPVKNAIAKCFNVQDNYNELCARVFYAVRCLYEADPPNFVFP